MSVFMHHALGDEPGNQRAPLLYNLVYCSRAAPGVDDAAVANIIAASQRNNSREGITGLLVFGSGIFFQWLEGPRDNVTHLMHRLGKDGRHDSIIALSESEEVRERLFPDWAMELVSGTDIHDVLIDALETAEDPKNAQALREMLTKLESGQLSALKGATTGAAER